MFRKRLRYAESIEQRDDTGTAYETACDLLSVFAPAVVMASKILPPQQVYPSQSEAEKWLQIKLTNGSTDRFTVAEVQQPFAWNQDETRQNLVVPVEGAVAIVRYAKGHNEFGLGLQYLMIDKYTLPLTGLVMPETTPDTQLQGKRLLELYDIPVDPYDAPLESTYMGLDLGEKMSSEDTHAMINAFSFAASVLATIPYR